MSKTIFKMEGLREQLLEAMGRELETLEQNHRVTKAGVTHEEAKPENDKDTRALEQSYLARGQALRVAELREALRQVRATELGGSAHAALGCLVTVFDEDDERERDFFLMPAGGGTRLRQLEREVLVVTPQSPWGSALVGAVAGEQRSARIGDGTRDFEVLRVQ